MIVIDGLSLVLPYCGVKSFTDSFLVALAQDISTHKRDSKYLVLFPQFSTQNTLCDDQEIRHLKSLVRTDNIIFQPVIIPSLFPRILKLSRNLIFLWSFFIFPRQLKKIQNLFSISAILHPYQVIANYSSRAKKIVVIHDIFHWVNSQRYTLIQRFFYRLAAQACRHCDQIISVSEFSKQQIIKVLNIPATKIVTCYEGISPVYLHSHFPPSASHLLKIKYNLPKHFILVLLSTRKYKKNLPANVKLFHELLKIQPNGFYHLVFVGGNLETNQQIKRYLINNKLLYRTKFIDYVTNDELRQLYHLSSYLFYLPLEEGFGLPPLEALACYTFPVISNTSSLGEIYSPYLPTFNPYQLKPIAQFLKTLTPIQRKRMILSARKSLISFYRWDKIIANYLTVFNHNI